MSMKLINEINDLIDYKAKYMDLLHAVKAKYLGETRHETALKYIKQAEDKLAGRNCKKELEFPSEN